MSSADFATTAYLVVGTLGSMIGPVFWELCRQLSASYAGLRGRPLRSRVVFVAGWEAVCVAFVLVGLVATRFPFTPEGYLRPPSGSIEALLLPVAGSLLLGGFLVDLLLVAWWLQPLLLRWCLRVIRRVLAVFNRP